MSALALSILLSLVSAVAYAGGAIMQERVADSEHGRSYAPMRRPVWWAAVALNGFGGVLHVVALAYGPLSVVQPMGALTIVFALPMAALFVRRKAGATAWRGAIMATLGLAGLLSLVGASEAQSLGTTERVLLAVVTGSAVVTLMVAGRAAHRHPAVRSTLLAIASGIAFGMSSVFTKVVAVDWSGGITAADLPTLALIAVLGVSGLLLSQAAYRGGGLAAPLATLTVVNPVVAAAVGITMFGETFRYGTTGTILALSCGVVAAGGLILLTTERLQHSTHAEALPVFPDPASSVPPVPAHSAPERTEAGHAEETAAEVSGEKAPGPVPAEVLPALAGLPPQPDAPAHEDDLVPANAAVPAPEQDVSDEGTPIHFGPFYGVPYVPIPIPALGRHRTRVKS
ncbi:DMT family transporter [Streptomyces sp. GQFP]|uniref:DMT family transporter n=1 Tax=Streptomyces sp. GQFP TaxID=2907545 RepID=UPI001F3423EE|nr:DMT family transporter [Streptomyces sp. GQFP]UIX29065.1 DMT family transporter [Streptomyces sp. GQFP]